MATLELAGLLERARAAALASGETIERIALQLHADPELMFAEERSSALLATTLAEAGFTVEHPAYGLATAFAAWRGSGPGPRVAVICEYDALPGLGHGCGHNLIAAAGVGAALASGALVEELGGRLLVLGTPAEEGGGGKILMASAGAFDGVDAALMVHPAALDLTEPDVLAIATWRVTYQGRAAHAAAAPEDGRNALDAAVLGYMGVAALRQHIGPTERIHGVFPEAGAKPNIVPERAVAEWYVRAADLERLGDLKDRVMSCLEAGAAAAGCTMTLEATCPEYSHLVTNPALMAAYATHSASIGRPLAEPGPRRRVTASTDMGNVSLLVPSIHPMVAASPPGVALHTSDFAGWAATPRGLAAARDGAAAMAMTAVQVWADPALAAAVASGA